MNVLCWLQSHIILFTFCLGDEWVALHLSVNQLIKLLVYIFRKGLSHNIMSSSSSSHSCSFYGQVTKCPTALHKFNESSCCSEVVAFSQFLCPQTDFLTVSPLVWLIGDREKYRNATWSCSTLLQADEYGFWATEGRGGALPDSQPDHVQYHAALPSLFTCGASGYSIGFYGFALAISNDRQTLSREEWWNMRYASDNTSK